MDLIFHDAWQTILPSLPRIPAIGNFMEAKYPKRITCTKVVDAICGGDYRTKFRTLGQITMGV